jgi:hypothetical protein
MRQRKTSVFAGRSSRMWFTAIVCVASLYGFAGCGTLGRDGVAASTTQTDQSSSGESKGRQTAKGGACASGCPPTSAFSGGEESTARENEARFRHIGHAANRSQRAIMTAVLRGYLMTARAGKYERACNTVSPEALNKLQQNISSVRSSSIKTCARFLSREFGSVGTDRIRVAELTIRSVVQVRANGGIGYILFTTLARPSEKQVVSMQYIGGRWMLAAPRPYPVAYSSPKP